MKTKHLFLTAILLVFSVLVVAEPVDPMRALEVAEQFAPQSAKAKRIKSKTAPEQSYEIVYTQRMPNSDRAAFYVVKLGEKGFVIISADDVANPILGYSYTNSWPTSISAQGDTLLPSHVLSFLNNMALQIETAIEKHTNLESSEEWNNVGQKAVRKTSARKSADALPDSVGPLLTTTWGQGQYYNALCPEDAGGEDGHVPTGCVATAMAQIINYWGQKEEIKPRGIHSYDSQYGNLTVNYDSTSYDFANMPDALTAESTPEQINAVAKLMYECGVAVNMQYSAWGSGAQNTDVIGAAVNHFRFSPEIKECFRYDYSDQEWFLALKNNLSNNSPIYYSGINDWSTGHAFVCDGYNEMDYFHINFGWNGYCDGWYNLSAVSTEIDFVHYQSAILSIYPKDSSILSGQNNVSIIITESVEIQSNIIDYNSSEWVTMSFISADPTKQLVLDILDSHFQNLFIYDGLSTDIACNTDKQTPIVSSNYAFTLVFLCRNVETIHLRITPESNCRTVGNVETQIEDSTIYLSWQEYGGDTQWLVEYGLEGFKLGTGTQHIVSTNYISINQAVGDDAYEIRIQPICDTLYDDCVYSVIVNERKFWNDIVKSEPHGYYLDKNGTIHISTAEGLAWISNCAINDPNSDYLKNNISIEADIDLSGYYWSPLVEWKGNLYGNGHIISNMHIINRPGEWPYGSYSDLGFISNYLGGAINDIGFINTTVVGKGNEDAATIVGRLVSGNIYNSYSKNCHIQTTGFNAGGLVGSGICNLYNCYTTGCITSYNRQSASSGGIVGRNEEGTMYNCYASVNVQSNKKAWRGLLCANSPTGYYENCYAEKDKYSTSFIDYIEQIPETKNIAYFSIENSGFAHITTEGAINYSLGDIDLVTALNYGVEKYNSPELKTWILDSITGLPKFGNYYNVTCPNVSDIKLQNIVHNNKDAVVISWTENGEASEWQIKYLREGQNDDSAIYINTSSMQDTLCGIELGYVYTFYVRPLCDNNSVENWGVSVSYMVDKPYWDEIVTTQPEGYVVDAFGNIKITSAEGLTWLSVCSNGLHGQPMNHYEGKKIEILTDIDLKGYRWRPIGQDFGNGSDTSFKGYFNGNHYTISNLYCNEYNKIATCGFFGSAWNAIIHNINLSNCCVYGNGNAGGLIGLLADSEVNNCHVNGVAKGLQGVGLLVGYLWHEETVIENSSVGGDIYGDINCGGLIGYAYAPKSKITNCYANVNVFQRGIIKDVRNLGGLVGLVSNSDISNCYTAGDVEVIISDIYGIVSGSIFGSVEYQMHLQNIYTNRAELPWCAFSYTECDTCISNIGLFNDKGIFQEVLNKSSNHPNNLLDALNAWVDANNSEGQYLHWVADTAGVNGGFPIFAEEDTRYIITFCNDDGTILQQDTLELGEMPEYRGGIPTKDSTEQYNYTFIGWGQEVVPVTKDVTYYAQYEATLNQYEVTFYNWDGTLLYSGWNYYGYYPFYGGVTPTRESDAQYTYTFTGWSPQLDWVSGNQAYYAQYESTLNKYEINFYNWDGTLLQSSMVNYGEWPAYYNSDPWRESDVQYTYTFTGWSPELDMVTGHQSYYAQYESTLNQYEISFYNWDGTLLQSNMVNYGEWPNYYNSEPTRDADAQYTYTFTGWSPELDMVTGHQSYYAQYDATLNQYEITFYDWDGELLYSDWVNYGAYPHYGGNVLWREADAQYTYTFTGWSPELSVVTGNQSYTAQYEATLNQYEVAFYDWDGTLLQSTMVNYGEWPTYYNSDPWRESDAQYTYTFTGWNPQLDWVTSNQSYYAQYESTLNQYEINFYDWDGTLLQSNMVNYGEWPMYYNSDPWREADAQYTYNFNGWSPQLDIVTGHQSYYAQYEATLNQYEITFLNWDGEVLQSTMVDYGAMPEYFGEIPTKPEDEQYVYTFSGWEPEITIVVAYAEYTAQYDATDKVTTAIQNTQSDEVKTYKILRNNKIFIIRGDKVYSILGHVIEDWMTLGL